MGRKDGQEVRRRDNRSVPGGKGQAETRGGEGGNSGRSLRPVAGCGGRHSDLGSLRSHCNRFGEHLSIRKALPRTQTCPGPQVQGRVREGHSPRPQGASFLLPAHFVPL